MHTNDYMASLATQPCNSTSICNIDLILLQKKALVMQNTMMQKSEFLQMRDCSRFLQIGSHISFVLDWLCCTSCVCTCVYVYMYVCACLCVHACVCVCMCVHVCVCMYVCIVWTVISFQSIFQSIDQRLHTECKCSVNCIG